MSEDVPLKLHEGVLYKRGKFNKRYKERWFVLGNDLKLRYYESQILSSESYMLGNDRNVCGTIDLLNVQLIKVIQNNECQIPEYIEILSNSKKKCAKNNVSNIIHLVLSSRTYILSTNTLSAFLKWLNILCKYVYGGIIYESYMYKQGRYSKSFKRRYFVLNQYKQIKYFNNHTRQILHGCIDLNDIHSFNIADIQNNAAPNENLLQLNGSKRIWLLCCDTKQVLTRWCQQFETLKLKVAKKIGGTFYKQDTTFFTADYSLEEQQFGSVRSDILETKENGIDLGMEKEISYIEDIPIQFKIIADGVALYKNINLTEEMFGMQGFEKGELINGKYVNDKIVQLSNELFCSSLELEQIGYCKKKIHVYNKSNTVPDLSDLSKHPSYFNI